MNGALVRLYRILATLVAAMTATALAACSPAAQPTQPASPATALGTAASAFPVTVDHAFGSTTIEKKPTRVATVAWANHEVPLALGVVPVGMSKATWGDDDKDGLLPWVKEKLDALGAQTPVLFDETDSIPFEQVAGTKPDVILAAYSGITKQDYETLSKIAPTIAYPGVAWGTSYEDMIRLNAKAMGMVAEGDQLIADLGKHTAEALKKYPNLKDKKVLFSSHSADDLSQVGFYSTKDPRTGFLKDNGFSMPAVVEQESAKSDKFYITVSAEKPELFSDVDFIVTYGPEDPAPLLKAMQDNPLLAKIPAVKDGRIVFLGNSPLAAAANPSPLSITWGIDKYFAKLNEAVS